MRLSLRFAALMTLSFWWAAPLGLLLAAPLAHAEPRLVSADGAVTETIVALGAASLLAAVDTTSHYPEEVIGSLPRVGYLRALPLEGVLSLHPTHLITTDEAGPAQTLDRLDSAGVEVVTLPVARTPQAAVDRIHALGELLGRSAQARSLTARFNEELDAVVRLMADRRGARALVLLAAGGHGVMLGGRDTAAHALLESVGLQNVMADSSGYKPASREALLASEPDVIVIAEASPGQFRAEDWPAITRLEAWQNGHRVTANAMLLLGFGPRLPEAMRIVAAAVPHPGKLVSRSGKSLADAH
tara:strand:- start:312 stop:1214 length:903 start_codon:yes stop_codon:yes gene_type:complete